MSRSIKGQEDVQTHRIAPAEVHHHLVERHYRRIKELEEGLIKITAGSKEWDRGSMTQKYRYPPESFKQPRMATTLAFLGPRGSGKSTCMIDLIRRFTDEQEAEERKGNYANHRCRYRFIAVRQVVDCTLVPAGVPIGLSALIRLRCFLGLNEEEYSCGERQAKQEVDPRLIAERRAFKVVREAYMLSRSAAGRVLEGTSTGGHHYAHQASSAANEALSLPDRVADWLQLAAALLGENVQGFILALDDVDLAKEGLRDFAHSLLDELHQPRLILIIGADLERLVQRVADSFGEELEVLNRMGRLSDDDPGKSQLKSARALLYKALPQRNRERLRPWNEEERWAFLPISKEKKTEEEEDEKKGAMSLQGLLLRNTSRWPVTIRNPALLPVYPRALENLWFALKGLEKGSQGQFEAPRMLAMQEDFIAFLAEARGEHDLAHRITARSATTWARSLLWPETSFDRFAWDHLVTAAIEGEPLLGLEASCDALPLPDRQTSKALWIELLLDLSLASGKLACAEWIRRFHQTRQRAADIAIKTDYHRDELAEQFRDSTKSLTAALKWTEFDVEADNRNGAIGEEIGARVGPAPLHEALVGQRKTWPSRVAQGIFVQRSKVLDEHDQDYVAMRGSEMEVGLLPRNVRSLLILVDSLSRAPWIQLSATPRRRNLRINAILAAGLVHSAYFDALNRMLDSLGKRGKTKSAKLPEIGDNQKTWLDRIRYPERVSIVEGRDQDIEDSFNGMRSETIPFRKLGARDLPKTESPAPDWEYVFAPYNALVECLQAYVKSPAFRDLSDPSAEKAQDETD